MQDVKFEVNCYGNAAEGGGLTKLTLCGINGEEAVLELDEEQEGMLRSRFSRSFYVRCKKEKILYEIENVKDGAALKALAKKYYFCDTCDFDNINLYGAKRVLKVVVEALYRYPRLRSKLCYIGSHSGFEKLLIALEEGDPAVLNQFNLQYICTGENAKKLGALVHHLLTNIMNNHEVYIASAMSAYGLFDAVLLDQNDYDGYSYLTLVSLLRKNEAVGFHPKGCHTPESVVYHELGHLLDKMCGLSEKFGFKSYYKGLSREEIRFGLSEYALVSPEEFIAEAFSEYMSNPEPRAIAAKVGALLDSAYAQKA